MPLTYDIWLRDMAEHYYFSQYAAIVTFAHMHFAEAGNAREDIARELKKFWIAQLGEAAYRELREGGLFDFPDLPLP